jgi:hypothetical protein
MFHQKSKKILTIIVEMTPETYTAEVASPAAEAPVAIGF